MTPSFAGPIIHLRFVMCLAIYLKLGSSSTSASNNGPQKVTASSSEATDAQDQMITATTFTTPSTSLGPSAKMSPLDVSFILYTRDNRAGVSSLEDQTIAGASNETIAPIIGPAKGQVIENPAFISSLNYSLTVKIVIHGFGSGGRRPWVTDMVYKLLDFEDANVIVVDWERGATMPNYVLAAGNTRLVGHKIAGLIKSLNYRFGFTGKSYHLIGFSLGAHVAGFAGMEIRNSSQSSRLWINRITGLDPASPLFEGYEVNDRLDPSDAHFVDVIHSNGDGVLRGGFGSLQPMGHVDFYPNGGRVQVGCNSVLLSALSDIIYGKWQSLCNHRRALNFFMDSFEIDKCRFRSFNCDSYENYLKGECFDCGANNEKCSYMGYLANYSKGRGKMYLTTHEDAPFCANQLMIKILGSKGSKSHWGKVEVTLMTSDGRNESFWLSSVSSQQSGGYESGGGQKDLTQQQHSMQSLIVSHPSILNFTHILLRYTKYKGWIYSGDESWLIDKVLITDSEGQVKSYCGPNTVLESHIISQLSLQPGNCTNIESTDVPPTLTPPLRSQSETTRTGLILPEASIIGPTSGQQQKQAIQLLSPPQMTIHSARTPRLYASMLNQMPPEVKNMPLISSAHSHQRDALPDRHLMSHPLIPWVK